MSLRLGPEELGELRSVIERLCGIELGAEKKYLIEDRLAGLVQERGFGSFRAFCDRLRDDPGGELRDMVVDAITTNETLWFRDIYPFDVIREILVPRFAREMREGKRGTVRIWSAASSTGQEPYSVAMSIFDGLEGEGGVAPSAFRILATDISPAALETARRGRYSQVAMMRGIGDDCRDRFFEEDGRYWQLRSAVRSLVRFEPLNLMDDLAPLGRFDVILCRNVAIYFSAAARKALFERMADILNPGGILFLGAAESATAYTLRFEPIEHGRHHYYRLLDRK